MHDLATQYRTMLFLESLSLIVIFTNILTMLKHFRWVEFFLDSVIHSLRIALSFTIIFVATLIGLAICCMTLYGNESLRYSTI